MCLRYLLRGRPELHQQHRRGLCREVAGRRFERLAGHVRARAKPASAPQGQGIRNSVRGLREDHGGLGGAVRPVDGLRRDRPGARRGGPLQTAGLPRDPPRPPSGQAGHAAPASIGKLPQRSRRPARGARRGDGHAPEGQEAHDPRRRRGPPLRLARRDALTGRGGRSADRHDHPGQERH